jgi:hypothetical protein
VKTADLKPGDRLTGFRDWECVPTNAQRKVRRRRDGVLYLRCGDGVHLLDGQTDEAGELVNCEVVR